MNFTYIQDWCILVTEKVASETYEFSDDYIDTLDEECVQTPSTTSHGHEPKIFSEEET